VSAPRSPRRLQGRAARALGIAACLLVLAVFPLVVADPTLMSIAVFTLIFMVAATAWNTFSGFSGYLALGHAVFFGVGGYAVALAARDWHFKGGWDVFALLPFGGLVAGLFAIPIGLVALRTRRHTFVVVTIAIFFIFQLAVFNLPLTGGTAGIQLPTPLWSADTFNRPFFWVTAVILVLTVPASWAIRRWRFGLHLLAIRDDADRARGLGVQAGRVKLAAFVFSAIPVGMVGGMDVYFIGQIFPQFAFDPLFDISIALMAFLGGLGTLAGPLLGALVLESLQQYFTQTFSAGGTYLVVYGVLFLAVVLLLPRGVVPSVSQLLSARRVRASERGRPTSDAGVRNIAGTAP
jgi:branched-chain amino acid transport system permease protein